MYVCDALVCASVCPVQNLKGSWCFCDGRFVCVNEGVDVCCGQAKRDDECNRCGKLINEGTDDWIPDYVKICVLLFCFY